MDIAVKTINLVKNSALSSRLFSILCDQQESDHQLLYHSEIRWLSRGKALNRLFEMRKQVYTFLEEKRSPLAKHYTEPEFLRKLAYMFDTFDQLNQFFQVRNNSVFLMADKIETFKWELVLWEKRVQEKIFYMFPNLTDILQEFPHISTDIQIIVREHLTRLT